MAGAVPDLIARAAINRTLRCAVEHDGGLWPILGGSELGEQPASSALETVQFFLIAESYPGDETPGQFTFGWRQTPGSAIDDVLIAAGRDKTAITLDLGPGALTHTPADAANGRFTVAEAEDMNSEQGLSQITTSPTGTSAGWDADDIDNNIRVGSVFELNATPADYVVGETDLFVVAAILASDSTGAGQRIYTTGRDMALSDQGPFTVRDPSTRLRVAGTGISFANDTSGPAAIGRLTMTMDQQPQFTPIPNGIVDDAYTYG